MACQGEFCGGKIPFYFHFKIVGQEIQWVNTVFSRSRSAVAALYCCFTSLREVISRKSDSKPLPVLQIKAITLFGLIRSPLQPREYRLFPLGPLPLIKGYQQNPQQKGYHKTLSFIWKGFGSKEIHLFKEAFLDHFHPFQTAFSVLWFLNANSL